MGLNLWVTGATLVLADSVLNFVPAGNVVGSVLMVIGAVLLWLGR